MQVAILKLRRIARTITGKYRNSCPWLHDTPAGDTTERMRMVMAAALGWCNVSPCFKPFFLQYS